VDYAARTCAAVIPAAAKAEDRAAKQTKYGLTEEPEAEAPAKFAGKCWLCRVRQAKVRDHNHETGKFRGMLCHGCNPNTVARADAYPEYLIRVAVHLDQPCHGDVLIELANVATPWPPRAQSEYGPAKGATTS